MRSRPRWRVLGLSIAAPAWLAAMLAGAAPGARAPVSGAGATEVVVLEELHTITGSGDTDTVVTQVAPGRVRIAHRGGVAILDVAADRFLLLDPATSTYRSTPLRRWEERIAAALQEAAAARRDTTAADAPDYDHAGDGGVIAGRACDRYHLYARQEIFPGEMEDVEVELWITRELDMPPGAYEAYRRVLAILDRIGLDAAVEPPPGVVLRRLKWTRPVNQSGWGADEVETSEVVRIERRAIEAGRFAIPAGYAPADSGASEH